MDRVLVTGANGFVGRAVVNTLSRRAQTRVRAAARQPLAPGAGVETCRVDGLGEATDWHAALAGCTAVVHTAARVHQMTDTAADPLAEFRRVNTEGTLRLAEQAVQAGVRRFVFLSSIKVNGEETAPGRPFTAADVPAGRDPYAVSKREAEEGLRALAARTGIEVVIIRPTLVYGPGVKANFASLLRAVARGIPLPFGAIVDNRRSLVGLDNLVSLIGTCVQHPEAAGQTFLVSDGEDLSTSALVRRMGTAVGRRARLLPVPVPVLAAIGAMTGRGDAIGRLTGSLQVDITSTRERLQWTPPVSVDEGLRRTAESLRS